MCLTHSNGFLFPRSCGTSAKISFKYEKLDDFCYHCRRIGHSISFYNDVQSVSVLSYGPELRVDPLEVKKINRTKFFASLSDPKSSAASSSTSFSKCHPFNFPSLSTYKNPPSRVLDQKSLIYLTTKHPPHPPPLLGNLNLSIAPPPPHFVPPAFLQYLLTP